MDEKAQPCTANTAARWIFWSRMYECPMCQARVSAMNSATAAVR
jgi:hypothetical protein